MVCRSYKRVVYFKVSMVPSVSRVSRGACGLRINGYATMAFLLFYKSFKGFQCYKGFLGFKGFHVGQE